MYIYMCIYIYSFIHSGHFYSAPSSPSTYICCISICMLYIDLYQYGVYMLVCLFVSIDLHMHLPIYLYISTFS